MSKSKGNIIDPLDLINQYGADALRFTLAALAAPGRDIKMSASRVEGYRNFSTKLWNAARFAEMNGCAPHAGFNPADVKQKINLWIIQELIACTSAISRSLDDYRFDLAAQQIYGFVWDTFCDWYLEFTKPILNGSDEAAARETRWTTSWVLDQVLHLLHPFMPFLTEELWEKTSPAREGRLITARWPEFGSMNLDRQAADEINWLILAVSQIRAARAESNVPPGAKLALRVKGASDKTIKRLENNRDLLMTLARLDSIAHGDEIPKGALQVLCEEATFILPLAGAIDAKAETARLEKEIARQDSEITRFEKKLANEKFVSSAPADVVEGERVKLAEAKAARAKLTEALQRLRAL